MQEYDCLKDKNLSAYFQRVKPKTHLLTLENAKSRIHVVEQEYRKAVWRKQMRLNDEKFLRKKQMVLVKRNKEMQMKRMKVNRERERRQVIRNLLKQVEYCPS